MAQHIKPAGISGLNTGHSLHANIAQFFEFGQTNKELVGDTALTITNAATVTSPDIGEAIRVVSTSAITQTVDIPDDATVLIVCRPRGSRAAGDPSSGSFYQLNAGNNATLKWRGYSGGYFESTHRGNYSNYKNVSSGSIGDDVSYWTGHAVAAHHSGTQTMKMARNGVLSVNTDTEVTQNYSSSPVSAQFFQDMGAEFETDLGAVVVFNKLLTDAELQSVTNNPWDLLAGAPQFGIDSVSNDSPTPGTSVTITLQNGTGPYTATLDGKAITPTSQAANSFTFDAPNPLTFDNRRLLFNQSYTLEVTDANSDADTATFAITPTGQFQRISGMPAPSGSILTGANAANSDYFHAVWTSGGNSQLFPADGDPDQLDLPAGSHVVDVSVYSDHDSNSQPYWSAVGTWTLTTNAPDVSLNSAVIQATGNSLLLAFTENVQIGAGGNGGHTLSLSNGAVTATYASGDGTNQLIYNLSRTVTQNETGTISYVQPGDGIEAVDDQADVASYTNTALVNQSAVAPIVPTISTQPTSPAPIAAGQAFSFTCIANTGGQSDPVTYQWYDASDDSVIAGATNSDYSGTALLSMNGLQVYCRCTSAQGGYVDSNTATLTVTTASTRIVTQQLVDRSVVPHTVLANSAFNYRVRNIAGAIVATGSSTTDAGGIGTLDSASFGAIGEQVYIEFLLANNAYAGYQYTLQATP